MSFLLSNIKFSWMLKSYLLWILNMTLHSSGPWRAADKTKKLFRWMFMNFWIVLENSSSPVLSKSWVSDSINAMPIEETAVSLQGRAVMGLSSHQKQGSTILKATISLKLNGTEYECISTSLTGRFGQWWLVVLRLNYRYLRLFFYHNIKNHQLLNALKVDTPECLWEHKQLL